MKTLRLALLSLLGFSALMNSCSKEKSFEVPGGGNITAEWEFKENKDYKGKIDTATIENFGTSVNTLIVEGTSSDGKELLSIQVVGINLTAGATYKTPQVLFQYFSSTATVYTSDITAIGDFTVVITKIDSAGVTGTFSGKVKDSLNASKTIVDGKFSAKLHTTPNPPVGNGQLTFWAKSSCTAGGNISVKLSNNQTGAITAFTPNEPTCGAAGTAAFTLPAGVYNWKANCGTQDSTSGIVTVQANQCVKLEVVFAPPTNCLISDIAFYDYTTNLPFGSIRSTYNASKVVNNIQFIDSVNGVVMNNWNITYPTGRVQIDPTQYFILDASGRIIEFHGYGDPSDNTSALFITKYTYDANGYMSGYTSAYADTPAVTVWRGVLQWTNGNLTKLTEDDPSVPGSIRFETTYDYYATTVKNFIYTLPLPELTLFQTAINAGKKPLNGLKTETIKAIDPSNGNVIDTSVTNYDNYVIDPAPNQYVRSFRQIDPSDPTNAIKLVLSYKCF